MDKKAKTIIKLNGRKFDASTGQPLDSQKSIDGVVKAKLHKPAPHHAAHPTSSKTLMRHAVKKPAKSKSLIEGISTPLSLSEHSSAIQTTPMVGKIDPTLLKRAKQFTPSKQISRFGATLRQASNDSPYVNLKRTPALEEAKAIAKPAVEGMLERAIENAKSHEQTPLSKKELKKAGIRKAHHGRIAAYSILGLMGMMVIAYAVYTNIPNVMVKVASVRAGFSAVMPSYRPSGYALSAVGYQPGMVSFQFKNNVDGRKFSLSEHSTNWDSATLVSSVIVPTEGNNYKKLVLDGQAIYLIGKDQASWVTNGVWYQVQGNGSLSTNQLIKLATNI